MELNTLYLDAVRAFTLGFWLIYAIFAIFSSVWIYRDARKLPRLFLGSKPSWWGVACFVSGPIIVLAVYWLIHHSSISNRISTPGDTSPPEGARS